MRARVTLGILFVLLAAAVALVLVPVSTSASSVPAGSANCGSIAFHTPVQVDQAGCDGTLGQRRTLGLNVAIAGLALGIIDASLALAIKRRRKHYSVHAGHAHPPEVLNDLEQRVWLRKMSDLERLTQLRDSGALTDEQFTVHRAGIRVRDIS
jgi:hypothetical protein